MSWIELSRDIFNPNKGCYPGHRPVENLIKNGILILDKWSGPTSHDVVSYVKKALELNKAGHSGTLDPAVTGVLIVALENACKVMPALQGLDKEYIGIMKLHKNASIDAVLKDFLGSIKQTPPVRSSVKRQERERKIYEFEIIEKSNRDICFRVKCEKGTYIRKLVDDIGKKIGGAHMTELRRISAGRFTEENSYSLNQIKEAYENWKKTGSDEIRKMILPVEEATEHLGKIVIKDTAVSSVANGAVLYTEGISRYENTIKKNDLVAIYTLRGELLALAMSLTDTHKLRKKSPIAQPTRIILQKSA
ncbi:MAG: RNA-guided pseudouridylation complex pseudouridine synthase subunit Cbf5 [Candidatus Aenigmarchaeota archaeon]|nr:RNA-guided pseudouridylation complex pseudouridine synthase subunit Cbf5 [Candidatus Aenigmarchaeota archaeon]